VNLRSFAKLPQVVKFCEAMYADGGRSPYLIDMLADIHIEAQRWQEADEVHRSRWHRFSIGSPCVLTLPG